jgi:hypothetical protein
MEPQQLSPGGVGSAATEASSTNGGTMGITVTEPDTSTMQKQTAGLSTLMILWLAAEAKICSNRCGKVHTKLQYMFSKHILCNITYLIGLVFIFWLWDN